MGATNSHGESTSSRVRDSGLVTAAVVILVIAGMAWARDILVPFLIAAVIVVIAFPVRAIVRRRTRSRLAATAALIASSYAILVVMAVLVFAAAAQFAQLLPDFYGSLDSTSAAVADFLRSVGLARESAESASSWLQPGTMLAAAESLVGYLVNQATAMTFVVVYIFFLSVDSGQFGAIRSHFAVGALSDGEFAVAKTKLLS